MSTEEYERHRQARAMMRALIERPVPAISELMLAAEELRAASGPWGSLLAEAASMLGGHPGTSSVVAPLLEATPDRPAVFELAAMALQELVLREAIGQHRPRAIALKHRLVQAGHDLGPLPLEPHVLEQPIVLREYNYRGGSSCEGIGFPELAPEPPPSRRVVQSFELNNVVDEARIHAALKHWGRREIKAFRLSERPSTAEAFTVLEKLPLESTARPVGGEIFRARVDARFALRSLFHVASLGGAYDSGYFGAYGRLHAWRALGAIVGGIDVHLVDGIALPAQRCDWFAFDTKCNGGWFHHVAWDLGIAALREDRRTLVAVAATDTD